MSIVEQTLKERAGRLYRQLLILQRLFQVAGETDDADWFASGEKSRDAALIAGIREVIDELTEHARILTTVPFPLSDWRAGDGPEDERWRTLTEIERRDVLALLSGYENLVAWGEAMTSDAMEVVDMESGGFAGLPPATPRKLREAVEFLEDERARVGRFRQEMGFLERRRIAS